MLKRRLKAEAEQKKQDRKYIAKTWVKGLSADMAAILEVQDKMKDERALKAHVKTTYDTTFDEVLPKLSEAKAQFSKYQDNILTVDQDPSAFQSLITSTEELVADMKSDKTAIDGILTKIKSNRKADEKKKEKADKAKTAEAEAAKAST